MPQQQNQTLGLSLEESIVNIQELTINYNDTLYVQCLKLKDYAQWIGICMNCFEDHPNQIKFVNLNGRKGVKGSEQYAMLNIVNFKKVLSTQLSSELNKIYKDCEAQQKQFSNTIQRVIEYIKPKIDLLIIEQQKLDSLESAYKKNNLNNTTDSINFMIECNKQSQCWKGYCLLCRQNVKHQIFIKIMPKQKNNYRMNYQYLDNRLQQNPFQNLPSSNLLLDKSSDYRLVDISLFQRKIQGYFEDQIYKIFLNKSQQILSNSDKYFMGLNRQFNKNAGTIRSLSQQIDKNRAQKDQYEKQQNAFEIDTQNQNNELQDLNRIVQQFEEGSLYDIQIHCGNLSDLTTEQGWKVLKNEFYDEKKDEICSVVSFYGLYNKGKSFLASKLSGKIISSGYSISTIGLSALYPRDLSKENLIIFLDTAGLETPINHHKKDEIYDKVKKQFEKEIVDVYSKVYEAKLIDRLRTESLIQQFILNQSHLILIIVDQLSKDEQKLIKRIKTKYQQSEIVIVHNFSKLTLLEEVQKYIITDIVNSFEKADSQYREIGKLTGSVYVEPRWDNKNQQLSSLTHVVMAKEYSEAGNLYNPFCYKYLESRIISINQFEKFDVITCLMAEVEKEIVNLFKLNSEQKKLEYKLEYNNDKNAITTNLPNAELKPISFDMLGVMQVYDEEETPKYNYQIFKDRNTLILNVELNGKFEPQKEDQEDKFNKFICLCQKTGCSLLEWHGFINGEQLIQLRAQYQGPHSANLVKPENANDSKKQRLNRFQLVIPVSTQKCVLKPSRPQFSFEQGLAKFEFMIQKQEK